MFNTTSVRRVSQFISRHCFSNSAPFSSTNLNRKVLFEKASVDKFSENNKNNFVIKLDNNYLKSPAGNVLLLKSELLALLISNEWNLNKNGLASKSSMHLTGLAFTALDNPHKQTTNSLIEKIVDYIDIDTLLYFSDTQTSIEEEQQKQWIPIIKWINLKFKTNLEQTNSLIELPKISKNCKERLKQFFSFYNFPALCGINYGAENLKSLILTIATIEGYLNVEQAVEASNLEQIIQSKVWGTFEWFHHLEHFELNSRISAAMLFVNLNSSSNNC